MLHDASNETGQVPEELYNLTQLADVTLAAGKLSTTSAQHKIKESIKFDEPIALENDATKNHDMIFIDASNKMDASPKLAGSDGGYISDLDCNEKIKTPSHPIPANATQMVDSDVIMADVSTLPAKLHTLAEQRQSSFSSSEDDSTYNYSHKIFDKRKSRKLSTHSDDARTPSRSGNPNKSHTSMNAEADDSMLSISEAEFNDDDAKHKKVEKRSPTLIDDAHEMDSRDSKMSNDGEMGMKATEDVHTCPECGKKYSTSSNLARHRQTHRSLHDKKARRCPHCDKGKYHW